MKEPQDVQWEGQLKFFSLVYHFAIFKQTIPLEPVFEPANVRIMERNRAYATIKLFKDRRFLYDSYEKGISNTFPFK